MKATEQRTRQSPPTQDAPRRAPLNAPAAVLALQRSAGNAAVSALLARVPLPGGDLNVGDVAVSFTWGAFWAPKGAPATQTPAPQHARQMTLPVRAGSEGLLRVHVLADVSKYLHSPKQLRSTCEWTVVAKPNGTLEIKNPAPTWEADENSPLQHAGAPQPQADPASGQVMLTQGYVGSTDTGGMSVGIASDTTAEPAPTSGTTFTVSLDVQGAQGPRIELSDIRAFDHKTHDVHFFNDGNILVFDAERNKLLAWFEGLSAATRRRLKAGTQHIRMDAYASDKGPAAANQLRYADGRLAAVKRILGPDRFVAEGAWIATSYGEDKPPDKDLAHAGAPEERPAHETSDPSRLIVRLEVEDERTEGADEADPFELIP
jgi:hypothetical protein